MTKNLQKNIAFSIDKLSEVDIKKKLSNKLKKSQEAEELFEDEE